MARPYKNLAGQRFGMLVAITPAGKDANGNYYWSCKCDCGNMSIARGSLLSKGKITDCGCIWRAKQAEQKAQREAEKEAKRLARPKEKAEVKTRKRKEKTEEERWTEEKERYSRQGRNGTLCWNCIRSAAPPSLQCIWDKSKGQYLPEGAEAKWVKNYCGYSTMVTGCPEFLSLFDRTNAELLKQEREKYAKVERSRLQSAHALAIKAGREQNNTNEWWKIK